MSTNLLVAETSPYLLQHKDNPVHWRPWGRKPFAEARSLNRPVLLSVGYAACHWCHVMAHESFENPEIAALMNALFVNIKVDREERPDVDALYQAALALLGEQGGWPLTMFLTPDGQPFWGGTYFPPTPRYGRPGFPQVLQQVAHVYHSEPEKVQKNVSALKEGLVKIAAPPAGRGLTEHDVDDVASAALRMIDPLRGGTAGAPKFPQPVFFRFLWHAYKRTDAVLFRDAVTLTLDGICQGGIYDHLGGGFARYSTDVHWLVPHFEKMLYDNALLIELLTEVWLDTRRPLYAARVAETIAWALRELRIDHPTDNTFACASAFDADSEGEEGRFYVWIAPEIDTVLGADAPLFRQHYDVTDDGNWEGRTILRRSRVSSAVDEEVENRLADCRRKLLAVRRRRTPPARDDKILADWNGLMIAALARAGAAFSKPEWVDAARACFAFINRHMCQGNRLHHVWCAGEARHPAVLEDYANMAKGALALYETTGDLAFLEAAQRLVAVADEHYWDPSVGGYFQSADDTTDIVFRSKVIADHAVPSGNATMAEALARLFHLTGEDRYRQRANDLLSVFSGDNAQYLLSIPGLLTAWSFLHRAVQVTIVGAVDDPATAELRQAVFAASLPFKVVSLITPGASLPAGHPAAGKTTIDGRPAAYVCVGPRCTVPLTSAADLERSLAKV